MRIAVCVKQVPEVVDAELELDAAGTSVDVDDLVMDLNEWDVYAVEEAVRLKERHGGTITVVTVGDEEAEEALRRALAMGADAAVRVDADAFAGADAVGIARGLAAALRELSPDLVLTGAQSADTGWARVGPTLAELLGLPWATLAVAVEVTGDGVVVHRELEANTVEHVALPLPCLVSVQTGINQPRYVSVMGIRKVRSLTIEQRDANDLGLAADQVGAAASAVAGRRLGLPTRGAGAEILAGSLDQVCERAAAIIREVL